MDCRECNEKLYLYIDDQLENDERNEFELHLNECDKCKKSYEEMTNILKLTADVEDEELPANYKDTLRVKLEEEVKENKKKRINWKVLTSVAASLLLVVTSYGFIISNTNLFGTNEERTQDNAPSDMGEYDDGVSFSGSTKSEAPTVENARGVEKNSVKITFDESVDTDVADEIMEESYALTDSNEALKKAQDESDTGVKIIKEAYLTLEIEEYDKVLNDIVGFVKDRNGYIEKSETRYINQNVKSEELDKIDQLKRGNIRIRIPEASYEEALDLLKEKGRVSNEQTSAINISQNYYDTKSVIKNLEVQEERLREILDRAENVDEILRVENELNRVRTEIDRHQGTINNWDSLVNYSTLNVSLIEIMNNTESIHKVDKGIFAKGKEGFISTINSLIDLLERGVIKLMTILPIIIILGILIILAIVIIRRAFKKRES